MFAESMYAEYQMDEENTDVVTCSGCGAYRGVRAYGRTHYCFRNEDGTLEEGGTFL